MSEDQPHLLKGRGNGSERAGRDAAPIGRPDAGRSAGKWTPGPWGVEYCAVDLVYHIEAGAWPLGSSICEIMPEPKAGEPEANARLIAAAPDLLEALIVTRSLVSEGAIDGFTDHGWMERLFLNQRSLSAAIAKAEGCAPDRSVRDANDAAPAPAKPLGDTQNV